MRKFNILFDAAVEKYPPSIRGLISSGMPKAILFYIYCNFDGLLIPEILSYIIRERDRSLSALGNASAMIAGDWAKWFQGCVNATTNEDMRVSHVTTPRAGVNYFAIVIFSPEQQHISYESPVDDGTVDVTTDSDLLQLGMFSVEKGFSFIDQPFTNARPDGVGSYILLNLERV